MATLNSWTDGPAKSAIVDFVDRVTTRGGPDYVEPSGRVAVFDNDGTLWCERPLPIQLDFTVRRLAELAERDPSLRGDQPWRAAFQQDTGWLGAAIIKHYRGDDSDLRLLMQAVTRAFDTVTVEEYDRLVRDFFTEARHPELGLPYRYCGFRPMVELMRYLERHGFTAYIASGGDRDFMRPIAQRMYGVPPERIIGSALGLSYRERDGSADLLYKAEMDFFDDGPEKPIRIWSRIGRRPILSAGNSDGDLPMLSFSGSISTPALRLVIHHDDGDREFVGDAGSERLLHHAAAENWTVVSMRDDWNRVFGAGRR